MVVVVVVGVGTSGYYLAVFGEGLFMNLGSFMQGVPLPHNHWRPAIQNRANFISKSRRGARKPATHWMAEKFEVVLLLVAKTLHFSCYVCFHTFPKAYHPRASCFTKHQNVRRNASMNLDGWRCRVQDLASMMVCSEARGNSESSTRNNIDDKNRTERWK